ncbi:MAG: DUF5057 domain-containing protein [Lachnospiraceae bacterium]|nr:DUF5057 domain-containing protein [Lachnospiraceae bacterium]
MSKKKILTFISVLAVVLAAASIISYSIAISGNGTREKKVENSELNRLGASIGADYVSNIDLAIQNSKDGTSFNIVEVIPSGASASKLSNYVNAGYFKKCVMDANSETSPKGVMAEDMIKVDVIKVSANTAMTNTMTSAITGETSTLQEILDSADLIYVSSPSYTAYNGNNNMSEEFYNYLHTYALGDDKPVIIDYVTKSNSGGGSSNKTFYNLYSVIANNHIRFRTFGWQQDATATDFFSRNTSKGSYYLKYNTNDASFTGEVLVITNDANATDSMYQKMLSMDEKTLISTAYYGNEKPKSLTYDVKSAGEITTTVLDHKYDFILIENSVIGTENSSTAITEDVYMKLKTLSETSQYIFYDYRAGSGGSDVVIDSSANNYLKLLELLVTNKGVSKYAHVLASTYGFFDSLNSAGENSVTAAKNIADIINAGDYRGSGSKGANGKVYRVLELQPCYPIDTKLAEGRKNGEGMQYSYGVKGNYYTSPSEVLSGVTSDEVENGVDYYNFTLSKAKIAYATGLKMNQIQIDQMSTDEFISSKNVVLETYDLVYIGGDTSALISNAYKMGYLSYSYNEQVKKVLTNFEMFTHTGQLIPLLVAGTYNTTMNTKVANTPGQSTDYAYGQVFSNGKAMSTLVELNGNDITNIKYEELVAYVNAGMPIIVENKVAAAFEKSKETLEKNGRLAQLALVDIDPDSWMYKALDKIYAQKDTSSVAWKLNAVDNIEKVSNADRKYGNTLGDDVTVFTKEINNLINAVVTAGEIRPTLTVVSAPTNYIEGNKKTYNNFEKNGCDFKVYAKSSDPNSSNKFKISLYIDVDGNGVFKEGSIEGEGECAQTVEYTYSEETNDSGAIIPDTVKLSYSQMDPDYYGIISWKIVATEQDSKLVSSSSGYAYYERKEDVEKKKIEILQIMPRPDSIKTSMNAAIKNNTSLQTPMNDGHSLYLCTECQLNMYRAEYNIINNGTVGKDTIGTRSVANGVTLGKHEHKFGIVKYDSTRGDEDWESNFADDIADDYDPDIDIVYADEFEDIVAQVQKSTDEEIAAYKDAMEEAYDAYESALANPDLEVAEEALKEQLISMHGNGVAGSDKYKQFAEDGEYYKVWYYYGVDKNSPNYNADLSKYRTLYNTYIDLYDDVLQAKEDYRRYRRLSYTADKWLAMNYDMIVLGFAEDFGGEDMNADACQMIADYVEKGGSMLNTHDSTTKYEKAGAMNISSELREIFGMDRYHVTGTKEGSGSSGTAGASEGTAQVRVPSFEYTSAKSQYADIKYKIKIQTDNGIKEKEFTLPGTQNKAYEYNVDFLYGFTAWNSHETFTDSNLSNDLENFTVSLTLRAEETANGVTNYTALSSKSVTIEKGVQTSPWQTEYQQVATGTTDKDGHVTITVPRGKEITEAAKTTKAVTTSITLKNTDKQYTVQTTDSAGGDGSIVQTSEGAEITDTTKKMTVTFKVVPPEGYEAKYLAGNTVTVIYNAATYTRSTNAEGIVSFEIPQIVGKGSNTVGSGSLQYRKFTTKDDKVYFFTERALSDDYVAWNNRFYDGSWDDGAYGNVKGQWTKLGYNSPVGLTDPYMFYNTGQNFTTPYKYVEYIYQNAITWDMGYEIKTDNYGPNGASKVNEGIVCVYPFKISSELRIAKTHSQTLALDLEDEDVSVWYTLSAGYGTTKLGASYYAASPHDGMDSYYLYSCGNVFYCGAGHSVVTGPKRDNNDERRLFINVIVNSVRNSGSKPRITLHEKDTDGKEITSDKKDGNLFINEAGEYYYNVNEKTEIPEFDFKVKVDKKVDLAEVLVYYDLDYGALDKDGKRNYSNNYNKDKDVLITSYNTAGTSSSGSLKSGALAKLRLEVDEDGEVVSGLKNLQLKQEYFEPYGNFTYIVIKATDSAGRTAYQRLKINLIPKLFELTMKDGTENRVVVKIPDKKHELV